MKKLGFIIINYNDYKLTKRLIDNVKSYKSITKILVVDNNSTDDSYSRLKKLKIKNLDVIKNTDNSYASGLNFGGKYLIEKLGKCNIIYSNSDIIIEDEKMLIELNKTTDLDNIGVVGPVVNEHGKISRGWPVPTVNREILFNLPFISRIFRNKYLKYDDSYYKDKVTTVGAVSGCFFLVNSDILEEINYFDTNTYLYYEENILAKKLEKTNYKIVINNDVEILHDHSVSIDKSVKRVKKYKTLKNSQRYFVNKYLHPNILQSFLLFLTDKISLIILYIRVIIGL